MSTVVADRDDDSDERMVAGMIGVARVVWGATTVIGSRQVYTALGISYPSGDFGVWIKAFGVRDVMLGLAALHPDSTVRRLTLRAGVVMDLFDAAVVATAGCRGLPTKAVAVGLTFAGGTAAFGTLGARLIRGARGVIRSPTPCS